MSVREFDGVDDFITCSPGAIGSLSAGAHSMLVIGKPTTINPGASEYYVTAWNAANTTLLAGMKQQTSTSALGYANNGAGPDTFPAVGVSAGAWQVLAVDRAAGTVVTRGHRKVLGSGSWTHIDSPTSQAAGSTAVGLVHFGKSGSVQFRDFRVALIAIFAVKLADADYVAIETAATTAAVKQLNPVAAWELNQASTATAVTDWTGGGANQSSIVGTTVIEGDDPPWSFGFAPSLAMAPMIPT